MSGESISTEEFARAELATLTAEALRWADFAEPLLAERFRAADAEHDYVGRLIALGAVLEAYRDALAFDSRDCRTPERGQP